MALLVADVRLTIGCMIVLGAEICRRALGKWLAIALLRSRLALRLSWLREAKNQGFQHKAAALRVGKKRQGWYS